MYDFPWLLVAAWIDPSCRGEVVDAVARRFFAACEARRNRAVTILDSLAELVRITPDMPSEITGLADDIIAAS